MLLFAIVLGLAAVAAAVTRPPAPRAPTPATAGSPSPPARETTPTTQVHFDAAGRKRTRSIQAGRRSVVTVAVEDPGQVELDGLGLTANAEPLTPARFDVLALRAGRHDVLYTPAGEIASRRLGVLRVVPARGGP
jgi:hypothetical protein